MDGSGRICKSTKFTLEIDAESCMYEKQTVLTGPNGYYHDQSARSRPFSLFGKNSTNAFYTRQLSMLGEYTMTIMPEKVTSDKVKVFKFNVINC